MTYADLSASLGNIGAQALLDVLRDLPAHRANAVLQNTTGYAPSLARKIKEDAGAIKLENHSAEQIFRFTPLP